MYRILTYLHFTLGLILFIFSGAVHPDDDDESSEEVITERSLFVRVFQIGDHVKGEKLSFHLKGRTEQNEQVTTQYLVHNNEELEDEYTYIIVEYFAPYSDTTLTYINGSHLLEIWVQDSFMQVPYEVNGYSLPRTT